MKYVRLILILVLAAVSVNVSAGKKKKNVWPTDSAYITHRRATIIAMDSVLRFSGLNPDPLMRFADQKCAEFNNDPVLMRAIASGFTNHAGFIKESIQRYQEIKRMYPKEFESYSDYAATLFDKSIEVKPDGSLKRDPEMFNLAKTQIDSAKIAFPKSKAPYLWWLERCTRYAYNDTLVYSFKEEVEAYRKAFPEDNADFLAASYMGNPKIEMNMTNFDNLYDEKRELKNYLRVDAEEYRRMETQKFFDKIDINTLSLDNLYTLTQFYYQSTESRFLGRDGKALLHEKGLERAKLGLEKFPNFTNFSRLQLWHAAELAKIYDFRSNKAKKDKDKELQDQETANRDTVAAQGCAGADRLMSQTDTLVRQDYYFTGVVKQYNGKYDEAIAFYKKAMGPIRDLENLKYQASHNCDSVTILENIANCYKETNQNEEAIATLKTLYDLRERHGNSISISDVASLATQYRAIGNDTTKTQQERFAAFVSADSIYANIQDSIDAGSKNFTESEGYRGFYVYQRYIIRNHKKNGINALSDYVERDNYLVKEIAEDLVRRVEPVAEKSEREKAYIISAAFILWSTYYNQKDYKSCLPYQKILMKYDPETSDTYKKNFEYARRHAGR